MPQRKIILTSMKIVAVSLGIALLFFLFWKNLVPSGYFEARYNFHGTPFISALRPAERLSNVRNTQEQDIIGDPIYFDLHVPAHFEKITVFVTYKNSRNQKFTIAAFTDRAHWQFRQANFISSHSTDDLARASAEFETMGLDIQAGTVTFILGAPEASKENPITVYEIRAVAIKQPITWKEMPKFLFKTFLKSIRNKL